MACTEHPYFAQGLASRLRFPLHVDGESAIALANQLNLRELDNWTDVNSFGAWSADADGGITHNAFVPNWFHKNWVAHNLVLWERSRTLWAFALFAPDEAEDGS